MKVCPKCRKDIDEIGKTGQGICPSCGIILTSDSPKQNGISTCKYCQYCGTELPANVQFCMKCGKTTKKESNLPTFINEKSAKPSNIWYAVPIILGIIGGIIGYFAVKNIDKKMARNLLILGVIMIPVWAVIGSMGSDDSSQSSTYQTGKTAPMVVEEYDVIIVYDAQLTNKIGYSDPKDGYVYMILNLDIENRKDKQFSTSPFNFKVIIDGVEYDYDSATYSLDDALQSVDLHKGGRISGSLTFEVPDNSRQYIPYYEALFYQWKINWIPG